ncbi:hypothetical protein Ddc_24076 [Ditylenchus destructor]|nr:hypothetical protein Ddc_24076 [Ditylenchus destructor]
MATRFECSQCPMILNESEKRRHISAKHLIYFPYECATCKEANKKHLETTEADMDEHIATYHNGNNLGFIHIKDPAKEIELNNMIEQCRRLPIQQISSIDSKTQLRRALNLLDGAGTSTVNGNAAQNGSDLTQVKDEVDSDDDVMIIEEDIGREVPNNTLDAILPEQAAQIEADEPNEQSLVSNCGNSETHNAVLPTIEPSVTISVMPVGL